MWWIEFRGRKILLFAAFFVLLMLFLWVLPPEAWRNRGFGRRGFIPFPVTLSILWLGGWFLALFLQAQDPYVTYGFDYGRLYRAGGIAAAALGLCGGIFLAVRYWPF